MNSVSIDIEPTRFGAGDRVEYTVTASDRHTTVPEHTRFGPPQMLAETAEVQLSWLRGNGEVADLLEAAAANDSPVEINGLTIPADALATGVSAAYP